MFIAPEGDHYRTRLTHTLEACGIARNVARALRLNEDLTEAIGLGHDLGHPPFGHIGEAVLDERLTERYGVRFRHNHHSLRTVERLERDGQGLNLTEQVRDGILHHTGPGAPATLEGKIVRVVDRIAYINHDIDDALRAGVIGEEDLPAAEIEVLGPTGSDRIETLVKDLLERSAAAGDIVQGEDVGGAMLRLRKFMFERVYLGPSAQSERARIERMLRALFDHYASDPAALARSGRVRPRAGGGLPGRHDRPLRHPSLLDPERAAGVLTWPATPRTRSSACAKRSTSSSWSPSAPTSASGLALGGAVPLPRRAHPVVHRRSREKLYYCFGCHKGGDPITFVRETQALDFAEAVEALGDRYRVELKREREDPQEEERRRRRERLLGLLDRAAGFYATYLWDSTEARKARDYLAERGLSEEVLRAFRVGYAPSAWDRLLTGARRDGFTEQELYAAGLAQRSRGGRVFDRFRERITFPLADSRGRVLGFGARAMRSEQGAKYLNTSEGELYHKGRHLFGIDLARPAISRERRAVVVEGYTDVLALHQAGVQEAVAIMGTALHGRPAGRAGAGRGPGRAIYLALDADSSGQEAMLRAARMAEERQLELRVVELPDGSDPADLAAAEGREGVGARLEQALSVLEFAVGRVLADTDRDSPEGRDRALAQARSLIAQAPERSARRDHLVRLVADGLDVPADYVTSGALAPPHRRPPIARADGDPGPSARRPRRRGRPRARGRPPWRPSVCSSACAWLRGRWVATTSPACRTVISHPRSPGAPARICRALR